MPRSHDFAPHVNLELDAAVQGEAEKKAKPTNASSDEGLGHGVWDVVGDLEVASSQCVKGSTQRVVGDR